MSTLIFPKNIPTLIIIIWLVYICLIVMVFLGKINESKIYPKEGLIINAKCVDGRTSKGIEVLVKYENHPPEKDFIFLPINLMCDANLLATVADENIHILAYKNEYLDVRIGDMVIRSLSESIKNEGKSSFGLIIFLTFTAFIASFLYIKKLRNKVNQSMN